MERRALQIAIALAACVPVGGGLKGAWLGARGFGAWPGGAADSHFRYLSGLLLAIGLAYWACIPAVERRGPLIRALTAIVVAGGLARLAGWMLLAGDPGSMRWALVMELGVAPAICLWQTRVAAPRATI
ncbi:MAG: DUF4345 domain-containing protein [Pseudomonadota bacterium]|nr:DUF4345 domain-containing protein [Pseudomonadota bacterium]